MRPWPQQQTHRKANGLVRLVGLVGLVLETGAVVCGVFGDFGI